jgi:hypothetical protein
MDQMKPLAATGTRGLGAPAVAPRTEGSRLGEKNKITGLDVAKDVFVGAHTVFEGLKPEVSYPTPTPPPAAAVKAVEAAGETAKSVSATVAASVVGGAVLGVGLTYIGLKEFSKAAEAGDPKRAFLGMGTALLGLRDGFNAVAIAGQAAGSGPLAIAGRTMASLLSPFALVHGALTTGFAISDTVSGVQDKDRSKIITGILGIGQGVALSAAAVGLGAPALIVAGVCLGGKLIYELLNRPKPPAPPPPAPPPQDPQPPQQPPAPPQSTTPGG